MPRGAQVQVLVGDDALAQIGEAEFVQAWKKLYQRCSWATAGQNPDFLGIWYRIYATIHSPVLVFRWADNPEELLGLLALCSTPEGLQHAASEDCEYHAWLADGDGNESFMPMAIDALTQTLGPTPIRLNYLPPDTPLQWLASNKGPALRCERGQSERRVLPLHDAEFVKKYLRKKSRLRTTMNKFKRTGTIQFRRVCEPDDAVAVIRACQPLFDFRKGALYGVLPFQDEPLRSEFLIAQAQIPGLLHISILERNDEVVAAHIGTCGKKELSIAGLVHSEFYSQYSPGSLLLVELIALLGQEGFAFLDFTPGDDEYKTRFAKDIEPVYSLKIYPTRIDRESQRLRQKIRETAKSTLGRMPEPLQLRIRRIRSKVGDRLQSLRSVSGLIQSSGDGPPPASSRPQPWLHIFSYQREKNELTQDSRQENRFWRKNTIEDLLRYQADRSDFLGLLRLAFNLVQQGAQMYTHRSEECLQSIYFLLPARAFANSERLRENDWILWGIDRMNPTLDYNAEEEMSDLVILALEFVGEHRLLLATSKAQVSSDWERFGFQSMPELDCDCLHPILSPRE